MIKIILASVLWGFSTALIGWLMKGNINPSVLICLRFFGSFLILLPIILRFPPRRASLFGLLVLGLASASSQINYYMAIQGSSVVSATFLASLAPVVLTLYGLLKGESLPRLHLIGLAAAMIGAYNLVVGPEGLVINVQGIVFSLASSFSVAVCAQLGKAVKANSWTVVGMSAAIGSLISLPFTSSQEIMNLTVENWGALVCIVLLGSVIPNALFLEGVHKVSPRVATLVTMINPVCAGVLAIFLVGQPLSYEAILGAGLVLLGVWFNTMPTSPLSRD